jgi:hypothetical protein
MNVWKSALLSAVACQSAFALTPQTTTVEFFNTELQHYFVTADAIEALAVDAGSAGAGWLRTGRGFGVWTDRSSAPSSAQGVCRFYSSGSHAHFYTADAAECAQLQALQAAQTKAASVAQKAFTGWAFEGVAFFALTPSAGQCASGTEPIYRFYSPGADTGTGSSHRFVSSADMATMMQDRGWTAEGVAFCSPVLATGTSAPAAPTTTSFPELAATWTGTARWNAEVKPDGAESHTSASLILTIAADGTLTGSGAGCTIAGTLASGDGFHSLYTGTVTTTTCTDAHFDGTFPLRLERLGASRLGAQFGSESSTLDVEVEALLSSPSAPPPPPPPASGPTTYTGNAAWIVIQRTGSADGAVVSAANLPLSLTLDGTTLSGSGNGCTFAGTLQSATGEELTGTLTTTGCTNAAFTGSYTTVKLEREDGAALAVDFEMLTTSGQTTTRAMIRGGLVLQGGPATPPPPPQPPQPPATPIAGTWTGDARWLAVKPSSGTSDASALSAATTHTLSLTVDTGGALTGSGFGCAFTGTLTQVEKALSGNVSASGCTDAAFNGTYASVELELEDGNALGVAMRMDASDGTRVTIVGMLASGAGAGTPPPPPPPPAGSSGLTGTWSGANAQWQDDHRDGATHQETESTHALTLTIAADGTVTGSGFGCAFTGSLHAVTGGEGSAFTGPLSATGCTSDDFNGAYGLFGAHLEDGGALDVVMARESTTATTSVRVSVEGRLAKQ